MPIVTRQDKGDDLTIEEVDNNFTELSSRVHIDIVPPTITNDSLESFVANKSMWLDSSTDKMYKCTDATVMGAVWEELVLRDTYFTDSMCSEIAIFQQDLLENEVFDYAFTDVNKAYILQYQIFQIDTTLNATGNIIVVYFNGVDWEFALGNAIVQLEFGISSTISFGADGVFSITNNIANVAKIKVKIQEVLI